MIQCYKGTHFFASGRFFFYLAENFSNFLERCNKPLVVVIINDH
jgi:hypothetical protein